MVTPQKQATKLAKKIGLPTPLYLKREDLHPLGSHKGRSLPHMINTYLKQGIINFVISSSGNAALAAGLYIKKYNAKHQNKLTLKIFVGQNIDAKKLNNLKKLKNKNISIIKTDNPKQSAFQLNKSGAAKLLRQSTDDLALIGYESLAKELSKIKNLSAVFIPTSSGTTAQGLSKAFKKIDNNPQIHIVQTSAIHPISKIFSQEKNLTASSLANAIVDKVAYRKNQVIENIKNSRGNGWIANDKQIKDAKNLIKQTEKINISANSALALAGLKQAIESNWQFNGPVVCLFTGA